MEELIRVRVQYASRQQCCKTYKRPLHFTFYSCTSQMILWLKIFQLKLHIRSPCFTAQLFLHFFALIPLAVTHHFLTNTLSIQFNIPCGWLRFILLTATHYIIYGYTIPDLDRRFEEHNYDVKQGFGV